MNKKLKLLIMILIAVVQFSFITKISAAISIDDYDCNTFPGSDTSRCIITATGTITVNNVDSNDDMYAYKVLDAYYNPTANTITYEFTTNFQSFINSLSSGNEFENLTVDQYLALTTGDLTTGSTQTNSSLDRLMSLFKNSGYASSMFYQITISGTTGTVTVPSGAYFVYPINSQKIYAAMVGNVEYKVQNGDWELNGATINAKVTSVGVSKTVAKKDTATKAATGSFTVGEVYDNYIDLTVPKYPTNSVAKTFTFTEVIPAGINVSDLETEFTISDGENILTVDRINKKITNSSSQQVGTYSITPSVLGGSTTFTIDFDTDKISANTVTVKYPSSLNSGATIGTTGNTSTVTLTYVGDVYSGTAQLPSTTTAQSTSTVYTYYLTINKYELGDQNKTLNGAVFKLCTTQACSSASDVVWDNIQITENGKITLNGVASGNYYLKEVTAPIGYKLPATPTAITVSNSENTTIINFPNTLASGLPFTGGMGTIIYTLAGVAVVLIVSIIFIIYKRKKDKDNQR